ncbi:MAG: hypothetical protein COA96_02315 [SAR86 cluster bacterium]|uniref:Uncharacterized protein n=1 Tax=SAR86 cluster bacterium TaxID=2030880 RepID=A0A2A5BAI2_9GAMM|nr:MAG: hypothetical protein COA96_02315 [SAR86 cluster bacterium]
MHKTRARAQAQFPSVLLTLISIIQALALELMWGKILESDFLWEWSIQAITGWGLITVSFMGILQIWAMYSTMVMGFVWQPLLRDSIVPFIIGIQEFMLISLIGIEFSTLWLYVLASLFVTAHWVSHSSLRRARVDPENSQFFDKVSPAGLRDFLPAIITIATLVLFGLVIDITGNTSWLPVAAIVFANIILFWQIMSLRSLWQMLMGLTD